MEPLRRLLSILLLAVFGLPFALPILAVGQDAQAGLPACCKRNGKHHCTLSMDERGRLAVDHEPQFTAPADKCPYCPASVAPAQSNPLAAPALAAKALDDLFSHSTGLPQTEARRRISHEHSNGKRGPPSQTTL